MGFFFYIHVGYFAIYEFEAEARFGLDGISDSTRLVVSLAGTSTCRLF